MTRSCLPRTSARPTGRPRTPPAGLASCSSAPYADWLGSLMPDPADREWLLGRLVPQPLATYTQPIRLPNPAAAAVHRTFVYCTEDKEAGDPFTSIATRLRSAPGWRYTELPGNHLAPVNAPLATAQLLLSLV